MTPSASQSELARLSSHSCTLGPSSSLQCDFLLSSEPVPLDLWMSILPRPQQKNTWQDLRGNVSKDRLNPKQSESRDTATLRSSSPEEQLVLGVLCLKENFPSVNADSVRSRVRPCPRTQLYSHKYTSSLNIPNPCG